MDDARQRCDASPSPASKLHEEYADISNKPPEEYTGFNNNKGVAIFGSSTAAAWLSRAVTRHPFKVLLLLMVQMALAGWWSCELRKEKAMANVVPRASNSVLRDFPETMEKIRDAMVFWCTDKGCDLTQMPQFRIERRAVQGLLDTIRARNRFCGDLEWSSMDSQKLGPYNPFLKPMEMNYMSDDRTASYVMYTSTHRECMRDIRRKMQRTFHRTSGGMHMSLGGPESVAGASMDAELRSMMIHAIIAVPISCLLLWLFVGNLFRVLTPIICMIAAYISGQAVVGIIKHFNKGLNVQYDDSFVLFIDLALCVDYALFFWTRFITERRKVKHEEALQLTLETSGVVVLVSNFFVVVAWTCTLCFPNLNIWGFQALYIEALCSCAFAGVWSLAFSAAAAAAWPSLFDDRTDWLGRVHGAFWDFIPGPSMFWKPWAKRITSKPLMLVLPILAYACMVPFVITLTRYQPSYDIQRQGARLDTIENEALTQFQNHFRLGMLSPVTLVVEAKEHRGLNGSAVSMTRTAQAGLTAPSETEAVAQQDYPSLTALSSELFEPMLQPGDVAADSSLGPESQAWLNQLMAGSVEAAEVQDPATADAFSMLQYRLIPFLPGNSSAWPRPDGNEKKNSQKPKAEKPRKPGGASKDKGGQDFVKKAIRKLALDPDFGQFVCSIAEAIMNKTRGRQYEIQMADMLSIWWLPPKAGKTGCSVGRARMVIDHQGLLGNLNDPPEASLDSALLDKFPPILRRSISKDGKKVQLKLFTRFSPSSPEAAFFDQFLRQQLERNNGNSWPYKIGGRLYSLHITHTSTIARQIEAERDMANSAPRIFGIFAAAIAILITLTFRSAFLCFKLALTVLCPIIATYGVTVAVYQLNMLGFLHTELFSATGGLDFRMIYVTPGVLFGLAMDYDLFLFARAYEHRLEGYDNTSAVRKALEETGPVITAAGVLMAISFFAIMLSNTILFRTLGFVFFFGVTFDVFVIRTCIAPVFLCVGESLNYWPQNMPKVTKAWH